TGPNMEKPIIESGTQKTWAPAGLAIVGGKLYFAGLKGEALYIFDPVSYNVTETLKGEYGRIREVIAGPNDMLYLSTSNRDSRGTPRQSDDRIMRINPSSL